MKISRDAELIATAWFAMGKPCSLTFHRPHIVTARAMAALDELEAAGMIQKQDPDRMPRGAAGWVATEKIGFPMRDFARPKKSENFKLMTE